ncbi:MAG: hypothetical protein P8X74_06385, partial [Reinekea sp.]
DSYLLPKNWGEPMGAPAIFEKQIEIKLLHPASTLESRIQETINLQRWLRFAGQSRLMFGVQPVISFVKRY